MMKHPQLSYHSKLRPLKNAFYGISILIFILVVFNTIMTCLFAILPFWFSMLIYSLNAFLLILIYSLIVYSSVLASRIYPNAHSYFKATMATFMLSIFFLFVIATVQIVSYILVLSGLEMSFILNMLLNIFGYCNTLFLILGFIFLFFALQRTPLTKLNFYLLIHVCLIFANVILNTATQMGMKSPDSVGRTFFISYIITIISFAFLAVLFMIKANEVSQSSYFTSIPLSGQPSPSPAIKPQNHGKNFCTNCGARVDPKETYCNSCGAKLI